MKKVYFICLSAAFILTMGACQGRSTPKPAETKPAVIPTGAPEYTTEQTVEPPVSSDPGKNPTAAPIQPTLTTPVDGPKASPTAPPAGVPPTTSPGQPTPAGDGMACEDQGAFIDDVTVPDGTSFRPGTAFKKTWRVINTGTCDWGAGYMLVFFDGDIMNGALSQPMPTIRAGEIGDITIDLVAPTRGGEQTGFWIFQNPRGERFGLGKPAVDTVWVKINVTFLDEAGLPPGGQTIAYTPSEEINDDESSNLSLDASQVPENETASSEETGGGLFGSCAYTLNQTFVDEILRLVNQARKQNGLQPVFLQDQLGAAALKHSADMACNGFVDHDGSDGSTWYQRVETQGYNAPRSARENIYVGDPSFGGNAAGAFNWWMNSQVHRDNILFSTVTEAGIGYVYLASSPQGGYYTLVLGRR